MSGVDEILAGYESLRPGQEDFYRDLHRHPELNMRSYSAVTRQRMLDAPAFLPPLQPTLRTGTEALAAAALAWLAPH
jgi:hypothetical protein